MVAQQLLKKTIKRGKINVSVAQKGYCMVAYKNGCLSTRICSKNINKCVRFL